VDNPLMLALTFVVAGGGAYLGSYLKKKGENLATHEDIDKLADQVRTITSLSKTIEARISDEFWQNQRRWEVKRDTIFEAMKKFGELEAAVALLAGNVSAYQEGMISPQLLVDRKELRRELNVALKGFGIAKNLVTLACGDDANRVLSSIQLEVRKISNQLLGDGTVDRETLFQGFAVLMPSIYEYLRKELGIEPRASIH
jgi:hypothetical protein